MLNSERATRKVAVHVFPVSSDICADLRLAAVQVCEHAGTGHLPSALQAARTQLS